DSKPLQEKKARDIARVDTVRAYIERKQTLSEDAPKETWDAVAFLRREAIKTLAEARAPAVEVVQDPQANPVEGNGPVAYGLLRVLAGLEPPATQAERAEAALGICAMKAGLIDVYQPDLGVYLVGNFIAGFVKDYQLDYNAFSGKEKEKDGKKI